MRSYFYGTLAIVVVYFFLLGWPKFWVASSPSWHVRAMGFKSPACQLFGVDLLQVSTSNWDRRQSVEVIFWGAGGSGYPRAIILDRGGFRLQ